MDEKPFLEELTRQSREEKLDLEEGVRYLLIATVGIVESTQKIMGKQTSMENTLSNHLEQWERFVEKYDTSLTNAEEFSEDVKKNPAFLVGEFFRGRPRRLVGVLATAFIALNTWISVFFLPGLRRSILLFLVPLGFPEEWVDILSPPGE